MHHPTPSYSVTSLSFVLLLVGVHPLHCCTVFFVKASLTVQKALTYNMQVLSSTRQCLLNVPRVHLVQDLRVAPILPPTILSLLPVQATLIYAVLPDVFLCSWFLLEATIEQFRESVKLSLVHEKLTQRPI